MKLSEALLSLNEMLMRIRQAFYEKFDVDPGSDHREYRYYCQDVYTDHPKFGTSIVVQVEATSKLMLVEFTISDDGTVTFVEGDKWRPIRPTYEFIEESNAESETEEMGEVEFAESAIGNVIRLVEDDPSVTQTGDIVPLALDVQLIRPGPGNPKDGHYYPAEMLKRDAHVFGGSKMYESDHRPEEKSTRTWVSTVSAITGFSEDGAPVGRVVVHDPDFAKRLLALDKAGLLPMMECSILAKGSARKGTIDGKSYKVVEAIKEAFSVDWVTRGGAGGKALKLSESEEGSMKDQNENEVVTETNPDSPRHAGARVGVEETGNAGASTEAALLSEKNPGDAGASEDETQSLSEAAVTSALAETKLPQAARDRLAAGSYQDQEALDAAITREVAYLKAITGSGRPVANGDSQPVETKTTMTEEEYSENFSKILKRHGLLIS